MHTAIRQSNLMTRARIVQAIRDFFHSENFMEVETPIRIPTPIPEANINPVPSRDWFLQASPEINMKRLLTRGHNRIFQVCKCFRDQERGRRHLPEMTLLEWYCADQEYKYLMDQTIRLVRYIADRVNSSDIITYGDHRVDVHGKWDRLTVSEAFNRYTDTTLQQALEDGRFDELLGIQIEPNLGLDRPLFLVDYPVQCGSLARRKLTDPSAVERFELYIAGLELCNGFSELTDASEQRQRFNEEQIHMRKLGKPTTCLPEKFLNELEEMPPAAGNALGVDRLVMLFTNSESIDSVVAFTPEEM